ncbi:hypothetical protein, partial [Pseudomonas sp. GD03903]
MIDFEDFSTGTSIVGSTIKGVTFSTLGVAYRETIVKGSGWAGTNTSRYLEISSATGGQQGGGVAMSFSTPAQSVSFLYNPYIEGTTTAKFYDASGALLQSMSINTAGGTWKTWSYTSTGAAIAKLEIFQIETSSEFKDLGFAIDDIQFSTIAGVGYQSIRQNVLAASDDNQDCVDIRTGAEYLPTQVTDAHSLEQGPAAPDDSEVSPHLVPMVDIAGLSDTYYGESDSYVSLSNAEAYLASDANQGI